MSVVPNEKQDELELKWKEWDNHIYGDQRDDKVSRASITSLATAAGFHFSGDSGSNVIYMLMIYFVGTKAALLNDFVTLYGVCSAEELH